MATGWTGGRLAPHESLRERALGVVRQAIVAGEIRAGELYSATALAHELGISVSPVREAMLTLVHEGIMEPVRNRGFRVLPVTRESLSEIVEVRRLLEVPAVVGLTQVSLDRWWSDLERLVSAIERAAAATDLKAFLEYDREFHLLLLEIAGNRRLVDIVATLRDQTRLYGLSHLASRGRLEEAAGEHRELLAALRDHDSERVRGLMDAHLGHITHEWSADRPSGPDDT